MIFQLVKLIWIVIARFRVIKNQMELHLLSFNVKSLITIQILFDLTRFRNISRPAKKKEGNFDYRKSTAKTPNVSLPHIVKRIRLNEKIIEIYYLAYNKLIINYQL